MAGSDEALLALATGGDRESLGELLERHGAAVHRRIAGRIPRRWRPLLSEDDVLQQTYADATLSFRRFRPRGDGSFRAWLTSLADCNLRDALRILGAAKRGGTARKVEPDSQDGLAALHEHLLSISATASRQVARDEAIQALRHALTLLPATYRKVVEGHDLAGRSIQELAAELDRSPGAVYLVRLRAHHRLAELMGSPAKYFSDVS